MYLLIDDMREIHVDIIARTAAAGKAILESLSGCIDCLGIDHDLGGLITGYDIVRWVICRGYLPKRVQIVTMNPVGREAIQNVLLDAGYKQEDNSNFVREN